MTKLIPVNTFDLIIFGGTGDLALRKLIPALFHRDCSAQLTPESRVICVSRSDLSTEQYLKLVEQTLKQDAGDVPAVDLARFLLRIDHLFLDAMDHSAWEKLNDCLRGYEARTRVVYLATPPHLFGPISQGLKANRLLIEDMRIVLEKPIGYDYKSAKDINDAVGACFKESQIFRIDHYLGKETVQNLLALRFGNSLFEPLWRRGVIDHVQITVAEDLGVDNRIDFYNEIGALRDMVQNHLLQLVCLVAMEPPASLADDAIRDEKIKVLKALKPIGTEQVATHTVRGQYAAGAIDGVAVNGYTSNFESTTDTETFVALKVEIDNWRWSGIPFYLRTGKRLATKHSEIVIQFNDVPHSIFEGTMSRAVPNRLSIMVQPNEGIRLTIMAKEPRSSDFELRPVSLDLSFEKAFGLRYPDAYERLIVEVLRGNAGLFMRRDEVETAWKWIDNIINGWHETEEKPEPYVAGSWGPSSAATLLDRDGRKWVSDI